MRLPWVSRAEVAQRTAEVNDACRSRDRALADLAIAEDALEAERQWRLTSLPALLAAEERAVKAEAEVASFRNVTEYREVPIVSGGGPNLPRQFPELRPPRIPSAAAVRAAFHQSTNEERP